MNAVTVGFSL